MPSYKRTPRSGTASFNSIINMMTDSRLPVTNGYEIKDVSTLGMILAKETYIHTHTSSPERFIKDIKENMLSLAVKMVRGQPRLSEQDIRDMYHYEYDENPFNQGTTEHIIIQMALEGRYQDIGLRFKDAARNCAGWVNEVNKNRQAYEQGSIKPPAGREKKWLDKEFAKELLTYDT
jgi:hypothetical protein